MIPQDWDNFVTSIWSAGTVQVEDLDCDFHLGFGYVILLTRRICLLCEI